MRAYLPIATELAGAAAIVAAAVLVGPPAVIALAGAVLLAVGWRLGSDK